MAPEIFVGPHRGDLADMFAAGVILFGFLLGRPPFKQADPNGDHCFRLLYNH